MKSRMLALVAAIALPLPCAPADVSGKSWIHGSPDCSKNQDPAIDVLRVDAGTFILRQNKCVHFEAPFIYVLFGERAVFVQDTGATADPGRFPLYDTVRALIAEREAQRPSNEAVRILVTHSHSHGDHTAGDPQFQGKPNVTLVAPDGAAVRGHFGLDAWPNGTATVDLGGRSLEVIPIPGHQAESIAVYDPQTGWLLTGDTLYPGRLLVRDWEDYRASIRRLVEFSKTHRISAVLGTHIEISRTGELFAFGSTHQPHEAALPLLPDDLRLLDQRLQAAGSKPTEIPTPKFVVSPLGVVQRVLGFILKWLGL